MSNDVTPQRHYMKTAVRVNFTFSAGHRIAGHAGKCRNLHGHTYSVWIEITSEMLTPLGMVMDFGDVREKFGGWISKYWDHAFLLDGDDEEAIRAVLAVEDQKWYRTPGPPTAETLARHLVDTVGPHLLGSSGVTLTRAEVSESGATCALVTL
jgi:6-pyruvoyltetrahydropterin/6-carboxytetrahydropterin synthase